MIYIERILFAGKFYIFLILAIAWDFTMVIIGHVVNDPMPIEPAFYVMNVVPMLILALYLSMTLVSFEKENITIEAIFTVPGPVYKVWLYKLGVQFLTLFLVQILLALITFFFMVGFSIQAMVINAFVIIFCTANINFFLSTLFRSGYVAGLITIILLFFLLILSAILYEIPVIDGTYWNFFLSPFQIPAEMGEDVWIQRLWYNKIGMTGMGVVFMYFGLNRLRTREPFVA